MFPPNNVGLGCLACQQADVHDMNSAAEMLACCRQLSASVTGVALQVGCGTSTRWQHEGDIVNQRKPSSGKQ